jgi:hypothetical protein
MPIEGEPIDPDLLVGRRVEGVTASWFVKESGVHDLIHVWLDIEGLGEILAHTLNGLRLDLSEPHAPYEMPELDAKVVVEAGTPAPLAAIVGQVIDGVRRLQVEGYGFRIGLVLTTKVGAVAIADVGDDLTIGSWPDPDRWSAAGVALDEL